MRLVTLDGPCSMCRRAGIVTEGGIVDVFKLWPKGPRRVIDILRDGKLDELKAADLSNLRADAVLPADTPIYAPVDRPGKIVALGLNSKAHCAENDKPIPTTPILFAKAVTAVTGPGKAIRIPAGTDQVDWEVELCAVIGREAKGVSVEEAMDYVAGYTIMNDVSARDWQFAVPQWYRAKSADTFAPMGPQLVTLDEAPDWREMDLVCRVNGRQVQRCIAGEDMIFSPPEVVSFISQSQTLEPGDCVSLGTTSGVGYYTTPQQFLKAGDVVECEISGLGCLANVVAG
ncbi:MAG: fumarylacetoacetate hydrolase family protein [Planctomycetes bacterium]|nr:fumarylacetoacetate hydrolase family protein [Planctomycetota bacterium]